MIFLEIGVVLIGRVVSLYTLGGVVALFWMSLGLREDGKNIVPFPSGKQETVSIVGYLLRVSLD